MEVVDVAVCCTAFIMLCLCALVFAILRHFLTLSSHLIAETEFQNQEVLLVNLANQAQLVDPP